MLIKCKLKKIILLEFSFSVVTYLCMCLCLLLYVYICIYLYICNLRKVNNLEFHFIVFNLP